MNVPGNAFFDVNDQSAQAEQKRREWQKIQDAVQPVILELGKRIADRITRRKPIEERWLEDLRQYHGIYEGDIENTLKSDKERSKLFINITRPKTRAWSARLQDMLFPADEKNWGIDATPVPELSRKQRELARRADEAEQKTAEAVAQHNADVEQGGEGNPDMLETATSLAAMARALREQERDQQKEIEWARKRRDAMAREIDDQLTEAKYAARCRDVIEDACKVGVGILKGPIVNDKGRAMWVGEGADYKLEGSGKVRPGVRRVSYWHFFPDMSAESMEECEDTFERHLPNRKMLRRMAKDIGFDATAVRELLKDGPQGQASGGGSDDLNFMTELRALENGGKSGDVLNDFRDRFVVWEFIGTLEVEEVCKMIRALGRAEDAERVEKEHDPLDPLMVRLFFCGQKLLRIDEDYILDSGASIYSVYSFEKAESSILGGVGVPRLMRNEQSMLNSAVRMMMDNAALATAPQVIIDKENIEPENGSWKLSPRKIWLRLKSAVTPGQQQARVFETVDIPMNQALLAAIVEMAVKFVDEAVQMPLIAQGEQGTHVTRTSSGMAMLFNSANVNFRQAVKNWDDDVTAPLITRIYDFNMQFSDKPEIKGDMKVDARGTSVLLVREVQAEQLMLMLREWSTHPILGVGFRAYHCMRMVLQAMSISPDDLLIPEEEYLEKLKAMSESGGETSPEEIRSQTQLQIAQLDGENRLQVAEINERIAMLRMQGEFAKLAQNKDISLAQIDAMFKKSIVEAQAKLAIEQGRSQSDERKLAVEVAMERENARRAEQQGLEPTGSGGAISMGARPAA